MTTPSSVGETHNTPTKPLWDITVAGGALRDIESVKRPSVSSWLSDRATKVAGILTGPQEFTRDQKISELKGMINWMKNHDMNNNDILDASLASRFIFAHSLNDISPNIFDSEGETIELLDIQEDVKKLLLEANELFDILTEAKRIIDIMDSDNKVTQELLIEVGFAIQTSQLNQGDNVMQTSIAKLLRDHYKTFRERHLTENN